MEITYHPKGTTGLSLGYIKFVPNGYNGIEKLPIILFFHGVSEKGDGTIGSLDKVCNIALPKLLKAGQKELKAIVICPQHYSGFYAFDRANLEANEVKPVLNYIRSLPNADLNRIYATGLSSGSNAVIHSAFYYPELITAAWAVAIQSAFMPFRKDLKGFPALLVSNEGDNPAVLQGTITALQQVEANLKTDIGTGTSHNSWDRAYGTELNYEWLFSQSKLGPQYINVTTALDLQIENCRDTIIKAQSLLSKLLEIRSGGNIYTKKI